MIISMGTQGIATLSQGTFQYNAQSVQKIYFGSQNTTAGEAYNYKITVQIGNRTIVNNVDAWALSQINASQVGGYNADKSASDQAWFGINIGSHVCGNDTIYVTVNAGTLTGPTRNVQVGALVNEPVPSLPLRLTEFSDSSFASDNVLQAYIYASVSLSVATDTIEIRNSSFSTTAPVSMFVLANAADGFIDQTDVATLGKLMDSSLPLSTTFNNGSSSNIVCVSAMENSPQARQGARRQARAVASVLTPEEKRAL
jgi:hypothetical protein